MDRMPGEPWADYFARKWAVLTGQPYDYGEMFGPEMPPDEFFTQQDRAQTQQTAFVLVIAAAAMLLLLSRPSGRRA